MTNLATNPQLTAIELSSIEALPVARKSFILAKTGQKLALAEKVGAQESVYQTLKLAEIQSGLSKIENEDLILLAKQAYALILDRYPAMTSLEFQAACRLGVVETYGQWYGMCLKSVNQWVKGYFADPEYMAAVKDWNKAIESQTLKLAESPEFIKLENSKKGLKNLFARYQETGRLDMLSFAYYDILNDLVGVELRGNKTLVTDPEIRKSIFEGVKTEMEFKYKEQKVRAEKRGDLTQATLIGELLSRLDGEGEYHRRCKEKLLQAYFDNLITKCKTLEL